MVDSDGNWTETYPKLALYWHIQKKTTQGGALMGTALIPLSPVMAAVGVSARWRGFRLAPLVRSAQIGGREIVLC